MIIPAQPLSIIQMSLAGRRKNVITFAEKREISTPKKKFSTAYELHVLSQNPQLPVTPISLISDSHDCSSLQVD